MADSARSSGIAGRSSSSDILDLVRIAGPVTSPFCRAYFASFSVPTFAYSLRISLDAGIGIRLGFIFMTIRLSTIASYGAVVAYGPIVAWHAISSAGRSTVTSRRTARCYGAWVKISSPYWDWEVVVLLFAASLYRKWSGIRW